MNTWLLSVPSAEQLGIFVGRYRMNPGDRSLLLEGAQQVAQRRWKEAMEHLMEFRLQGLPDVFHERLRMYEQKIDQTMYLVPEDIRTAYEALFGPHDLKETEQH